MQTIRGTTQICAVIGNPVHHSMSPVMHNAAFQALHLDYAYVAFHVLDAGKAVEGMRGFQIRGLSVTIPHKVTIMSYLDEITPLARRIGAVNTITNNNGVLSGTNTDGLGALHALEQHEFTEKKSVLILGVGGSARAVAFTLACERNPQKIILAGKKEKPEKTRLLTSEIQEHTSVPIQATSFEEIRDVLPDVDWIIHTTPVGMHPHVDDCLLEEEWIEEKHLVFDLIYNPAKTLLLQRAERRGAKIVNGVPMFVMQGAEQFRLWTGENPPIKRMLKTVEQELGYR